VNSPSFRCGQKNDFSCDRFFGRRSLKSDGDRNILYDNDLGSEKSDGTVIDVWELSYRPAVKLRRPSAETMSGQARIETKKKHVVQNAAINRVR